MHTVRASEFTRIYDPSVGEAERWYINDHTIARALDGTWHLIGITHAEPANWSDELHLAHATASSLHGPWIKQPYALSTDPSWQETHLWAPHCVEHDGRYWMFVCGGGASPEQSRIRLATSDDGHTWTRHADNPMVVDGYEARDPMVLRVDGLWVMYYTANAEPSGGNHVVCATFSDDLLMVAESSDGLTESRRSMVTWPVPLAVRDWPRGAGGTPRTLRLQRSGRWPAAPCR